MFALHIMKLVEDFPNTFSGRSIGIQLVRSGTSIGANYRSSCRARSKAEFIAKLGIVVEEADECCYWLELVIEGGILSADRVSSLYSEALELTAIFVTSIKTARANKR